MATIDPDTPTNARKTNKKKVVTMATAASSAHAALRVAEAKVSPLAHYRIPPFVQFDRNQHDYERLDEMQALHTALCFLCSINADVTDVQTFLHAYPEALLLDGTTNRRGSGSSGWWWWDESAHDLLIRQSCSCSDNSPCRRNRQAIVQECLSQDFRTFHRQKTHHQHQPPPPQEREPQEWKRYPHRSSSSSSYYHSSHRNNNDNGDVNGNNKGNNTRRLTLELVSLLWSEYNKDLILLEHDIRQWRQEEWKIRQKWWETTLRYYEPPLSPLVTTRTPQPPTTTMKDNPRPPRRFLGLACLLCPLADGLPQQHDHPPPTDDADDVAAAAAGTTVKQKNPMQAAVAASAAAAAAEVETEMIGASRVFWRDRHRTLLLEIKQARQIQFRLLTQTFHGIQRHACMASQYC